jgi:hypothetical protein
MIKGKRPAEKNAASRKEHLMRGIRFIMILAGCAASTSFTRADDAARAIVDRAIKAHGGEALLAKYKASVSKVKGAIHRPEGMYQFTGEMAAQGPDQTRGVFETEVGGVRVRFVSVLNKDKGWEKVDDEIEELDKEQVADAQEDAHAGWVASLAPLKDKAYTLAPLGEMPVDGRAVVGVKVSCKGRRDVNLYFDKETALLVLCESRGKDEETNQEVTERAYSTEYKDVQGVKTPMKTRVTRDDKLYVEMELTEIQYHEKLDHGLFGRP